MYKNLADAAEALAKDKIIINSYNAFYNGRGYFLTKNNGLNSAMGRPSKFPEKSKDFIKYWFDLENPQRKYLLDLAGLNERAIGEHSYNKIKNAYNSWGTNYYVVDLGSNAKWSCNLFVGEALYMLGKRCLNTEKKYYSAQEIRRNNPNFTPVKLKDVERGNIVSMLGGAHVEIVTNVVRKELKKKLKLIEYYEGEFCSQGAGRSDGGNGEERCSFGGRELHNSENIFFKV